MKGVCRHTRGATIISLFTSTGSLRTTSAQSWSVGQLPRGWAPLWRASSCPTLGTQGGRGRADCTSLRVVCLPPHSSANTMFEMEWHGRRVALKASNGRYVCMKKNGQLAAISDFVGEPPLPSLGRTQGAFSFSVSGESRAPPEHRVH